ncbi:MAG: GTP cyclohydrolase I [Bradymonadia bacterium]|jgi:GTP cyclohydrolase I
MTDSDQLFTDYLLSLGIDLSADAETAGTPRRFSELLKDWFVPDTPVPILHPIPTEAGSDDLVIVRDIAFHSLCAHHITPFFGTISIAFEPDKKLVGFGGLNRLAQALARRPQLQERLVAQIADALFEQLSPKGILVVCQARQMCMELTGTPAHTETVAIASRGTLRGSAGRPLALQLSK